MVGNLGELCTITAEPGVKAERVSWTIAIRVSVSSLFPGVCFTYCFQASIRFDSYMRSSCEQTRLRRVSVCVVTEQRN